VHVCGLKAGNYVFCDEGMLERIINTMGIKVLGYSVILD
jgi:hypothetical protein